MASANITKKMGSLAMVYNEVSSSAVGVCLWFCPPKLKTMKTYFLLICLQCQGANGFWKVCRQITTMYARAMTGKMPSQWKIYAMTSRWSKLGRKYVRLSVKAMRRSSLLCSNGCTIMLRTAWITMLSSKMNMHFFVEKVEFNESPWMACLHVFDVYEPKKQNSSSRSESDR